MKRHLVSLMFFTVALSSGAQTVISDPEHRAKYEAALKDAARYKAEQQYYDNWVKVLQPIEPFAKGSLVAADWVFNYREKLATVVADKYDECFAPKFSDDAAGYAAEQQYYERRVKALERWEIPLNVADSAGQIAEAALLSKEPTALWGAAKGVMKEAAIAGVYSVATGAVSSMSTASSGQEQPKSTVATDAPVQTGAQKWRQDSKGSNSATQTYAWNPQAASDWGGTTNQSVQSTNNATQAWGSQNNGSWQCAPSQWNSQNSPVAWPKN